MAEVDQFLEEMASQTHVSEAEDTRIRGIWEQASLAADDCERHMPAIGWLSFRKRYQAFIATCERLDHWLGEQRIDDEQAQLALTITRRRNRAYRKAENMFLARARTMPTEVRQQLPLSAQQLVKAMQFPLSRLEENS